MSCFKSVLDSHFLIAHSSQLLFSLGMTEMVRKITLSRAVRIMQNLFPEEYNFYPRSWILPDEFQLFVAQVDDTLSLGPLNYVMVATVFWKLGPGSCVLGAGVGGGRWGVLGKLRLAKGVSQQYTVCPNSTLAVNRRGDR